MEFYYEHINSPLDMVGTIQSQKVNSSRMRITWIRGPEI